MLQQSPKANINSKNGGGHFSSKNDSHGGFPDGTKFMPSAKHQKSQGVLMAKKSDIKIVGQVMNGNPMTHRVMEQAPIMQSPLQPTLQANHSTGQLQPQRFIKSQKGPK